MSQSGNVTNSGASTTAPKRPGPESSETLAKKPRLDDPSVETLEDDEDDEEWVDCPESVQLVEDDLAPSAIELEQAVVEPSGLVRVGQQSRVAHDQDIRSAPRAYAKAMLERKLGVNGENSDAKVPGADSAGVKEGLQRLLQVLMATLLV